MFPVVHDGSARIYKQWLCQRVLHSNHRTAEYLVASRTQIDRLHFSPRDRHHKYQLFAQLVLKQRTTTVP
jgi:hypothetical protein